MYNNRVLRGITSVLAVIGLIFVLATGYTLAANPDSLGSLTQLLVLVKTNSLYELDTRSAVQGAAKGIVASLGDPYSDYLTPEEFEEMNIRVQGTLSGVGVVVTMTEDGSVQVVSPIKGTPAERAGIKTGDLVIAVNGESTRGLTEEQVVSAMRGDPGTEVKLEIYRPSTREEKTFRIIREVINVPSVEWKMLDDVPGIAYIRLNQFNAHSDQEMAEALQEIQGKKAQGVILDLRDNPGGDFNTAVNIADMFMDNGVIVKVRDSKGNEREFSAKQGSVNMPMVVLINGGSASAAEILSGCLKDHKLASLVGEKSFGKGLVQTIYPLRGGDALKLTTDKYFTPNGTDINKIGIQPDYVVKPDEKAGDAELQRAVEILKQKLF